MGRPTSALVAVSMVETLLAAFLRDVEVRARTHREGRRSACQVMGEPSTVLAAVSITVTVLFR